MSILKYKDPKTGEFKRINPYKADLSFVGKDGIVVNKAANSEKIEISGSGCVQATTTPFIVYSTDSNGNQINRNLTASAISNYIPQYSNYGTIRTQKPDVDTDATNKKYVDDNYVKKVKFTNLEQALYGYILDTTEEAYADLDSAVLKDSVTVGDNVYPIADKTRALVSRIEGKTTKMVQLIDKSKYYGTQTKSGITATNNGDGSWTINGTATKTGYINFSAVLTVEDGHKVLLFGNKPNSAFSLELLNQSVKDTGNGGVGNINAEFEKTWGIAWASGAVINNVTITPQLFDLTAMNREDITSAEQFKAEFPEFYPYENGNIYPAKISGVKFTGKNLKNIPNGIGSKDYAANELPKNISLALSARLSLKEGNARVRASWIKNGTREYAYGNTITASTGISKVVFTIPSSATDTRIALQTFGDDVGFEYSNVQIEAGTVATAYEPYIEPVSVTLPQTYDLHGIGDYKDYLEITKNENNELYTLKKIQQIEKKVFDGTETISQSGYYTDNYQGYYASIVLYSYNNGVCGICNKLPTATQEKNIAHITFGINNVYPYLFFDKETYATVDSVKAYLAAQYAANDPLIIYYIRQKPVETVIATNLTYEQVTAIRHNGGLIEVESNTNKGYARPTVKNTVVYRLTATNTAEG